MNRAAPIAPPRSRHAVDGEVAVPPERRARSEVLAAAERGLVCSLGGGGALRRMSCESHANRLHATQDTSPAPAPESTQPGPNPAGEPLRLVPIVIGHALSAVTGDHSHHCVGMLGRDRTCKLRVDPHKCSHYDS